MTLSKRDRYVRGTTVPLGLRVRNRNGDVVLLPCPPQTIEIRDPAGTVTVVGPSRLVDGDNGPEYRFDYQTDRVNSLNGNWEASWIVVYTFRGEILVTRGPYFFELVDDL